MRSLSFRNHAHIMEAQSFHIRSCVPAMGAQLLCFPAFLVHLADALAARRLPGCDHRFDLLIAVPELR